MNKGIKKIWSKEELIIILPKLLKWKKIFQENKQKKNNLKMSNINLIYDLNIEEYLVQEECRKEWKIQMIL